MQDYLEDFYMNLESKVLNSFKQIPTTNSLNGMLLQMEFLFF